MGDFDTDQMLTDWDSVVSTGGSVTAVTGGVTFSGIWAQRGEQFAGFEEQLRDEVRFTVATTFTELPTAPSIRQTVVRASVTYVVEAVRQDAESACIEFDVKRVL